MGGQEWSPVAEWDAVSAWIKDRVEEGGAPEAIAIFVQSAAQLDRGYNAIEQADQSVSRDRVELLKVTNTERQLLYVACTRARDFLLVTSAIDASEFIQGLHQ